MSLFENGFTFVFLPSLLVQAWPIHVRARTLVMYTCASTVFFQSRIIMYGTVLMAFVGGDTRRALGNLWRPG